MEQERNNELFSDSDTGSLSLESILAEYKSSAYMAGEKRTPSDELQRKTDDIIRGILDDKSGFTPDIPAEEPHAAPTQSPAEDFVFSVRDVPEEQLPEPQRPEPAYEDVPPIDTSVFDEIEEERRAALSEEDDLPDFTDVPDDTRVFPGREYASAEREDDIVREVSAAIERGAELEEDDEEPEARGRGIFRRREKSAEPEPNDARELYEGEDLPDPEPVPDLKREAARYASFVPSLRFRWIGAFIVTAVIALLTLLYSAGKSLPFGIGDSKILATGVITILGLVVMALGVDVLVRGFEDILRLEPGVESLTFISCLMSVLDGIHMLLTGSFASGLPFSLISCVSLLTAMSARKLYYMAMCDSLRSSVASTSFYGVTADSESMEERRILKKISGNSDGFYWKLVAPDAGEKIYDRAAPYLVILSFVLAFLASVGRGRIDSFAHDFSALTAVCSAFPAALIFALPFRHAASSARKSGGAIAGWEGAEDIFYTDGALITDLDLYPYGSVTLSGMKPADGVNREKLIICTSSLIIASGSGISRVFEELLRSQGLNPRRTDDFSCYDGGGIGAVINGERVLVGTGAFMNLMGIRCPEELNTTSSIFTAINDRYAGVFSLNYVPSNSVHTALLALLRTKTNLLMAVRDFNVTPNTVKQKFSVSMDGVEYLPIDATYELTHTTLSRGAGISAILCRGGLAPFAEVITRGRLLKLITDANTFVTLGGTLISAVVMFFLGWSNSFAIDTVRSLFILMGIIWLAVILLSRAVKRRL